MWKQIIGQFQELVDLYGSHPVIPTVPPPDFLYLQPPALLAPPTQLRDDRWCFMNLEDNPLEDDHYTLVTKPSNEPKKSRRKLNENPSSNVTMEPVWKELPEDLQDAILARLPVAAFFRFRSVCQKWNSLITSNTFSSQCARLPRAKPWFYTITHVNIHLGAVYDPNSRKWHHLSFPAAPMKPTVLPVAAAGGLVCLLDLDHRSLFVCNPLTRSFKKLPATPVRIWSRVAVGMNLNEKSADGAYQVVWVGVNGEYEVYDSKNESWIRSGSVPACVKLPLSFNFRSQPVAVDGSIYFLRSDPDGVVGYDTETGNWKQFPVPVPPDLGDHTLAVCGGRILLVGMLTKNAATCVCIWELQKMTLLWKEVDRMPNIWCLEFYGKHIKMSCLGNRGLIMLSLRSPTMDRLVTYDILKKEWAAVPGCVHPHDRSRRWIAAGVAFHPCLTATA